MATIKGNLADGKPMQLSKGKYAIVDADDFEWLNQWKWTCFSNTRYAARRFQKNNKATYVYMHRLIMNVSNNNQVDHINGDGLDNRRCNLRIVTIAQNHYNHKLLSNNKSGFNGVSWDKRLNKWVTCISVNNKTIHLGQYNNKIEAALAYNKAAKEYFGEYARLNQIGGNHA